MSAGDGKEPPLWKAAQVDDSAKCAQLLAARADVTETVPPFSWTALHAAAGYGALRCCEVLLQAKADVAAAASDGETPLHLAAQSGEERAIRLIVAARADVNALSEDRETPLHVAVQHLGGKALGHVAALVELRADVKLCNEDGHNALALARIMTNRADEIIDELSKGNPSIKDDQTCITSAVAGRSSNELEQVLSTACQRGQVDCVKQLLELLPKQSVKAAASRSMVPAAASGQVEVAEVLLAASADVCTVAADEQRTSPLIAAADEGAARMLRWLLSNRADVESTSKDGATALMAVSSKGSDDGVEVLLSAKANPNKQATNGWTALMFAAQQGRLEVARKLLDAKADLGYSNADSFTARALAAVAGHGELTKLFDTRAKLAARRAKAGQAGQVEDGGFEAPDTRDLDSLLASMGEGPKKSAPKSTKSGKKSKRAKDSHEAEDLAELQQTTASTEVSSKADVRTNSATDQEQVQPAAETQHQVEEALSEVKLESSCKDSIVDTSTSPEPTPADHTSNGIASGIASGNGVGALFLNRFTKSETLPSQSAAVHESSVGIDAKLRSLAARLKDVALRRAQLDAEEAQLIEELEALGAS